MSKTHDLQKKKRKKILTMISFFVIGVFLIALFFLSTNIGSIEISMKQMIRGLFIAYDSEVATVYDLRFPRIIISILAGAGIAVSGVLFQAVLKNPLADPGIIGISSGASFSAVLITAVAPAYLMLTPLFAFLGGVVAFTIVYSLSWKEGLSPLRIILIGVAVNALFMGLTSAFNGMTGGDVTGVAAIVEGNIAQKTWDDVMVLFPYLSIGLLFAFLQVKKCNLLMLEDKTVRGLGIEVNKVRIIISIIAVLLVSISTAIVGTISFLGLIVPHIGRIFVGSNHKTLIPFSALLGAFVFLLADTLGRTIADPYEISASVIMSIIGGPFFIILLRGSKKYAR